MYTCYLWLDLAESTEEADAGALADKVAHLEKSVIKLLVPGSDKVVKLVNYHWVLQCSVSHNHKADTDERLRQVLRWIVEHLPGSYGLAYIMDDEDPEYRNLFRVLVVARGHVMERVDPFLSPRVPTVED
jgi:hypothetical protein